MGAITVATFPVSSALTPASVSRTAMSPRTQSREDRTRAVCPPGPMTSDQRVMMLEYRACIRAHSPGHQRGVSKPSGLVERAEPPGEGVQLGQALVYVLGEDRHRAVLVLVDRRPGDADTRRDLLGETASTPWSRKRARDSRPYPSRRGSPPRSSSGSSHACHGVGRHGLGRGGPTYAHRTRRQDGGAAATTMELAARIELARASSDLSPSPTSCAMPTPRATSTRCTMTRTSPAAPGIRR